MWSRSISSLLVIILLCINATVWGAEKTLPTSCKQCNMHIATEKRNFSVFITEGIETSAWDDIGCAMAWRDNECAMRMSAFDSNARVFDYLTGESLIIEKAFFAHGSGVKTPMGYDVIAFAKKEDALVFVKKAGQGRVITYNDLMSMKWKANE